MFNYEVKLIRKSLVCQVKQSFTEGLGLNKVLQLWLSFEFTCGKKGNVLSSLIKSH